ncbi:MAG: fused MFS/spermidine synthase [Chromatiales bacterium]|jgi:spermidine synthase|nr:fused MFS/spermidine synthase [Chromatiales bacterium]
MKVTEDAHHPDRPLKTLDPAGYNGTFHRNEGTLIAERDTAHGRINVFQNTRYRWLEFDDGAVQSAMDRAAPDRLVLPYTPWMLAAFPIAAALDSVTLLGLGGGALARFLSAGEVRQLIAVEYNEAVIDIATSLFAISPNMVQMQHMDARDYLRQPGPPCDVLMCDLFTSGGMPPWSTHPAFYDDCRQALAERGMLAVNLLAYDVDQLEEPLFALRQVFDDRVIHTRVPGTGNVIAFAFVGEVLERSRHVLAVRAQQFQERWELDFTRMMNAIFATNRSLRGSLRL